MDLRHLLGKEQAEATVRRLLLVRTGWTAQTGDQEPPRTSNPGSRAGLESKPWEQKPNSGSAFWAKGVGIQDTQIFYVILECSC